jgi:hypothetical protein
MSIFTIAHYRKRAIIGFLTMFAGQMTGTLVINNYGPSLYKSLGYGPADQLILAGGWITVALFGNAFNAYFLVSMTFVEEAGGPVLTCSPSLHRTALGAHAFWPSDLAVTL